MSSVSVGVSLTVATGVSPPRVPQVQQVVEGQLGHQQQGWPAHKLSPQQLGQAPPDDLQHEVLVEVQQHELELDAEVSLWRVLRARAQKVEVVHNDSKFITAVLIIRVW